MVHKVQSLYCNAHIVASTPPTSETTFGLFDKDQLWYRPTKVDSGSNLSPGCGITDNLGLFAAFIICCHYSDLPIMIFLLNQTYNCPTLSLLDLLRDPLFHMGDAYGAQASSHLAKTLSKMNIPPFFCPWSSTQDLTAVLSNSRTDLGPL